MNSDLLKKLSENADILVRKDIPYDDNNWEYKYEIAFERIYAELIIRECINEIESYKIYVGNSPAGEMAFEWTLAALEEIRDSVKEKFGIE